jgi:hypothetical protein
LVAKHHDEQVFGMKFVTLRWRANLLQAGNCSFGAGMRFSTTSRSIVWLVVAALLLQPWLGQRAVAKAAETLNGLVICTGTGFEVISVPADVLPPDQPADTPDHDDASMANCLACLVQALGQLDGVGRAEPPGLHSYWIGETTVVDRLVVEPLRHRPMSSRGPPAV